MIVGIYTMPGGGRIASSSFATCVPARAFFGGATGTRGAKRRPPRHANNGLESFEEGS